MRKAIEFRVPKRIDKLTELLRIKGVPVYFHWTVLLIVALIVMSGGGNLFGTLLGLTSYLGVLVIHESGHLIAAQRMRCDVHSIRIYPIFGVTEFETPWSRFDHCVIAWGGVAAQAIVALPAVLWITFLGHTRLPEINGALTILGSFNLAIAAFNLLPFPPLDGMLAWSIFPEWIKRLRSGRTNRRSARRY